jgi:hypothetical protein
VKEAAAETASSQQCSNALAPVLVSSNLRLRGPRPTTLYKKLRLFVEQPHQLILDLERSASLPSLRG